MKNGSKEKENEQRQWLIARKQCCGICPKMLAARNRTSLLEVEIVCLQADGEAICPKRTCETLSAMLPSDLRGIDPMLLVAANQMGIQMPVGMLAA